MRQDVKANQGANQARLLVVSLRPNVLGSLFMAPSAPNPPPSPPSFTPRRWSIMVCPPP